MLLMGRYHSTEMYACEKSHMAFHVSWLLMLALYKRHKTENMLKHNYFNNNQVSMYDLCSMSFRELNLSQEASSRKALQP